jgi:hypothetical protein
MLAPPTISGGLGACRSLTREASVRAVVFATGMHRVFEIRRDGRGGRNENHAARSWI